MQGEIRGVRRSAWTTKGHEYDSQHPVLVVAKESYNQNRLTLAVPVMTPDRAHENGWEVNLTDYRCMNTCALVTGLRTVQTAHLTGYVDTAGPGDMDQVAHTIREYLEWDETWVNPRFRRGAVYRELQPRPNGQPRYCAILRHNPFNGVALTMAIGDGNLMPETEPVALDGYAVFHGQSLLHSLVKPSSVRHRLGSFVTSFEEELVNRAVEKMLEMIHTPEPGLLLPP